MKEALKTWISVWIIVFGAVALVIVPVIIFEGYWGFSGLVLIWIIVFIGTYFLFKEDELNSREQITNGKK